jgi:hypothetical protein
MSDTEAAATAVANSTKSWMDFALAFLDWPFLFFVGISVFVWFFRDSVAALLGRGDIQISWGENRHIKLTEISEGIDEELDPLKEDIQLLKNQVINLEASIAPTNGDSKGQKPKQPEGLSADAKEDAKKRLLAELKTGKYRWRSMGTIAKKAAISEDDAVDILRAATSDVVLSIGKTGRQIARHVSR